MCERDKLCTHHAQRISMAAAIGERRPAFNQPYTYPSINKAVRIMKARCASERAPARAPPTGPAPAVCVRTGACPPLVLRFRWGCVCLLCVCFVVVAV